MFGRFTERARQVVVFAQEEARKMHHNYIGTEHILLGLMREKEGLACRVLNSLGVDIDEVRGHILRIVGHGDERLEREIAEARAEKEKAIEAGLYQAAALMREKERKLAKEKENHLSAQIPFTPRAKKVLELSLREALSLGHNYIGTEHILLGLVRENEGVANRILLDHDLDAEKVRTEIIHMLGLSKEPDIFGSLHKWLGWSREDIYKAEFYYLLVDELLENKDTIKTWMAKDPKTQRNIAFKALEGWQGKDEDEILQMAHMLAMIDPKLSQQWYKIVSKNP